MSSINAINANGVFHQALIGMGSASKIMEHAAKNIANTGLSVGNRAYSVTPGQTVTLSGQSQGLLETSSLEQNMVKMMQAGTTYSANAKVVKAADTMLGSLFNMVA